MSTGIMIRVSIENNIKCSLEWPGPKDLVFGRQYSLDEVLFEANESSDVIKIPVVPLRGNAASVSRSHIRISKLEDGRVEIENMSKSPVRVFVSTERELTHGDPVCLVLPTNIVLGRIRIDLDSSLNTLSHKTQFHTVSDEEDAKDIAPLLTSETLDFSKLIGILSRVTSVLQQSTSKDQLFETALNALKQLIDVDGVVIAWGNDWENRFTKDKISPSTSILRDVQHSRKVQWSTFDEKASRVDSQMGIDSFIAAPIVVPDQNEESVFGVLYAHRVLRALDYPRTAFSELHAQIFEMIACSVAAGVVRLEHQNTHSQFQQFFTPSLAKLLLKSNKLLEPSEKEVTVLFCDIRGFSRISEKLGASTEFLKWVNDVLSDLSACVLKYDGVLVDYVGDELLAMWGAPQDQPDHAIRACQCAVDMNRLMPEINNRWLQKIGLETQVGVGINTGMACVGNTGSKQKFKYGPLGDTVNQASRVQGLTKFLKVKAIMTGQTKQKIAQQFVTRRLGNAKVVNIDKPIELFELCTESAGNCDSNVSYEQALGFLESGDLDSAARVLKQTIDFVKPDHPTLLMMNEVIERKVHQSKGAVSSKRGFIWDFKSK